MPPAAPTTERLLELIDAMAGQQVAMLVDLVADRYIHGTPKRISREAPVLILRHDGETFAPGGGANAIANVAALGGRPLPLGVVGDDRSGDELRSWLEAHDIPTGGVRIRPRFRTPTKTRVLGGGRHAIKQQIVRFDVEDQLSLEAAERDALLTFLADHADGCGAAVLSDYGYGTVDPALAKGVRGVLGDTCPLLGDSRYRLDAFDDLDGATPNTEEAERLAGQSLDDLASLENHGRALRERLGTRFLLITRGSDGMSLFDAHGEIAHLPVHGTDQVADVTGAGDTVIGTVALALAAGASPLEAACLATYAGGEVVMKMGTATLDRSALADAVRRDPAPLEGLRWAAGETSQGASRWAS